MKNLQRKKNRQIGGEPVLDRNLFEAVVSLLHTFVLERVLWFSILLRPGIDLASSPQLTTWAAEAISGAIQNEFSLAPTIKLPNDVQIDGRKVAGVLIEMRAQEKARHLAIAGIGVNVNQSREDFPKELKSRAISLAMALGKPVDRQSFAIALLRELDRTYRARFRRNG